MHFKNQIKLAHSFFVAILFTQVTVFAQLQCADLFFIRYGQLKPQFKHSSDYSVEIPLLGEIKNQCSLGTCHLYAWSSKLESDYYKKNNALLKISSDYLSAKHWLETSLKLASLSVKEDSFKDLNISLGSNANLSRALIEKYGLIPESSWQAPKGFNLSANVDRINAYIKNIIARARLTYSNKNIDLHQKIKTEFETKKQIKDIFENVIGHLPTEFVYEGKTYTPSEFQKEKFSYLSNPMTQIQVSKDRKVKSAYLGLKNNVETYTKNIDQFELALKDLIDNNQTVYLSYQHTHSFVDKTTGVMTIGGFELPYNGGPLSRKDRELFELDKGGHAVQVVGYDYDSKNKKIIKWKIKNSWGENSGQEGYYHMYRDYFRAFVNSLSFYKE